MLFAYSNAKFVDLMDKRYKEPGKRRVSMKSVRGSRWWANREGRQKLLPAPCLVYLYVRGDERCSRGD
jgi:hypothetical protein